MDIKSLEDLKCHAGLGTLGTPALVGIVVIVVMVAALSAGRVIEAATAKDFPIDAEESSSSAQVVEGDQSQSLFVHVSGAVNDPGLYEVSADARVADAVQAAGGFSEDAATDSVNLARQLSDGEQVHIASTAPREGGDPEGGSSASANVPTAANLININTATVEQLVSLPGIGESTAAKIVADRQANGSYKTVDDLKRVSGIGEKKFEAIRDLICV